MWALDMMWHYFLLGVLSQIKSSFSEKATKIWKNLPLVLTLMSKNNFFVKTGGRFFQILWPSHNVWTLSDQFSKKAKSNWNLTELVEEFFAQSSIWIYFGFCRRTQSTKLWIQNYYKVAFKTFVPSQLHEIFHNFSF